MIVTSKPFFIINVAQYLECLEDGKEETIEIEMNDGRTVVLTNKSKKSKET